MEKTSKTFLWWGVVLAISCLCIWGIRLCNQRDERIKEEKQTEREIKKEQEQNAIIADPYMYVDKNGVCHIDRDCHVLTSGYRYADENPNAVYSVSYQNKNNIQDWIEYAANHQLCVECFDGFILDALVRKTTNQPDSIYIHDANSAPIEKTYNTYDLSGNLIKKESWKYEEGQWKGSMKDEYEYDAYGREIMHASYFWRDGEWEGNIWFPKADIEYDGFSNVIRRTRYEWKDGEWILDNKSEYKYDKHNNLTMEKFYKSKAKTWLLKETKIYENFYPYRGRIR